MTTPNALTAPAPRADLSKYTCVFIAGGFGTRLQPVWAGPKCLVPVAGAALLAWQLYELEVRGARRFVFALGHRAEEVIGWLRAWKDSRPERSSLEIKCTVELEPRGRDAAASWVPKTGHWIELNADTYAPWAIDAAVALNEQRQRGAVVAMHGAVNAGVWAGVGPHAIADVPVGVAPVVEFYDAGTPEGLERLRDLLLAEGARMPLRPCLDIPGEYEHAVTGNIVQLLRVGGQT